jgi:hypothetical protein
MSRIKLTWRENLMKYAFWLGPGGHNDKENQVKMYKVLFLVHYLFYTIRIWIRIKLKSSIRIRIKRVWIHNTEGKVLTSFSGQYFSKFGGRATISAKFGNSLALYLLKGDQLGWLKKQTTSQPYFVFSKREKCKNRYTYYSTIFLLQKHWQNVFHQCFSSCDNYVVS